MCGKSKLMGVRELPVAGFHDNAELLVAAFEQVCVFWLHTVALGVFSEDGNRKCRYVFIRVKGKEW